MLSVEDGRLALRYTTTKLDSEIKANMDAAVSELEAAGVAQTPEADTLIDQAVRHYLRWQFNYMGRGPEYERAYKELRDAMALRYTEGQACTKQSC